MPIPVLSHDISDLESSFEMVKEISFELEVRNGEKRVIYVACAYNLWLNDLDIRGRLALSKFKVTTEQYKKVVSWWPFKRDLASREKKVLIWQFTDSKEFNNKYLIAYGEPARSKACTAYCETGLLSRAADSGVILSNKLLDLALTPIYDKLMSAYRTVSDFRRFQS